MYSLFRCLANLYKNKSIIIKDFIISLLFILFIVYMYFIEKYGVVYLYNEYISIYDLNIAITFIFSIVLYHSDLMIAIDLDKSSKFNNFVRLITVYYLSLFLYNTGIYIILFEPLFVILLYPITILYFNNFNKKGNNLILGVTIFYCIFVVLALLATGIRSFDSLHNSLSFHYCSLTTYLLINSAMLMYYTDMSMSEHLKEKK